MRIGKRTKASELYQFQWLSMTFFKVTIIQRQITWKWYKTQLYLQWPTNRKSYMIYRTAPTPCFKVAPFFVAEYLRNTTYRHSFNEILIGTYTRCTQQCNFKWPGVISSDLAKYWMTRSVARSLYVVRQLSFLLTFFWVWKFPVVV